MTNPPPPPLDLEELKRLAAEATPGPWAAAGTEVWCDTRHEACCGNPIGYEMECCGNSITEGEYACIAETGEVNARLIVAAVNSLPALIAIAEEVERLRARNAMLEDALDQAHSERSEDHWP